MKTIKMIDMTLCQVNALREGALSFKEKLEIARALERLKVDGIELAPIGPGKADLLSNKTIAAMVSTPLIAAVEIADGDIGKTWESVRGARHPRLNLLVPLSPALMEYSCHRKAPAMLQLIAERVKAARGLCESVPALSGVRLLVQVSDGMSMGMACAAAAIAAGADGMKCTAVPAGYPTLEQAARFVEVKGAQLDIAANLRTTELSRVAGQLNRLLAPREANDSPLNNVAIGETAGVCLDANDEIGEVVKVVRQLGYDLSEEDNAKVYEAFRRVADRKHFVGTRELDAIVASTALQVPSTYHIESYVINSGNVITATANILLNKGGEKLRGVGVGDGPIDAAFLAIEQIIGHHYELDDFQIQTVTEGRDAMGQALVKLRADGKVYSGNGISTDIIGASIRAYISALNKIVYEEA